MTLEQHRALLFVNCSELATGGGDVSALTEPDRCDMVPICDNATESFDLIEFGALKIGTFNLVERDKV